MADSYAVLAFFIGLAFAADFFAACAFSFAANSCFTVRAIASVSTYREALGPLNEAIKVAGKTPGIAYPTIAVTSKIEALSGLGENQQALVLAAEEIGDSGEGER